MFASRSCRESITEYLFKTETDDDTLSEFEDKIAYCSEMCKNGIHCSDYLHLIIKFSELIQKRIKNGS